MADLPEPVTLEWIARQLVEMHAEIDYLAPGLRRLIELLTGLEAKAVALHEEMRAFNEEQRQRAPTRRLSARAVGARGQASRQLVNRPLTSSGGNGVRVDHDAITPLCEGKGMKVVSFVTQKGGSGKSTTAASIAVAALQQGRRVFLLELDRQGTLSDWADARQSEAGPDFEQIEATALEKALATLKAEGYELAIVDTPGVDSPATVAAMRAADLCLVPCRPTATDLRGCHADRPDPYPARKAVRLRPQSMPAAIRPG